MQFRLYHLESGLERISLDLGGQFFFNCIDNYINNFLNSKNWVEIHGGFAALAFITESAKDIYKEKVCRAYFGGLLPENPNMRDLLSKKYMISRENDFKLLEAIGRDCAGAISFHQKSEPQLA